MNTRAFTLALIIAGLAMMLTYSYIDSEKAKLIKIYGVERSVVVAKMDIQELDILSAVNLESRSMPEAYLVKGAYFSKIEELDGTMATVPVLKGEILTKPRVTFPGFKSGLARQVSVDKRAMSITVSPNAAVSKLIRPGDRVDVIAAIDYASGRPDKRKVKTILQDVLVLSTGVSMTNSIPVGITKGIDESLKKMNLNVYTDYNTVTLELSPYEAQKMIFLLNFASTQPYLTLRNNSDKKYVRIQSTRIFDVLEEDAAEAKTFFMEKYQKDK